jgi:hypothetical protein
MGLVLAALNTDETAVRRQAWPAWGRVAGDRWVSSLAGFAVLFLTMVSAAAPPVIRRGLPLRSEVVRIDHEDLFTCALAPATDCVPRIVVTKFDRRTWREIKVYQKLLDKTPEETDRSRQVYEVIGEVKGDEEDTRQETVNTGVWAGEPFEIEGEMRKTDADGIVVDTGGYILDLFDRQDLGKTTATVRVRHARLREFMLQINRSQLLESFGVVHMHDPRYAGKRGWTQRDGLQVKATFPADVHPGLQFQIRLEVENSGKLPTGEICGRTISRHAWLDSRNFYIGIIEPGGRRVFWRTFSVPPEGQPGTFFAVLGLYDHILRAMPEKNVQMRLTVSPAPAK